MSTQAPAVQPARQLSPVEQKQVMLNTYLKARMNSFAEVLPQHLTPDRMVRVALTAAVKNPTLLDYAHENPSSFVLAIMQASELGLEPDTPSQFCHLIPYTVSQKDGENWKKIKTVQFQIGYRGLLELIRRSGEVSSFHVYDVHRGDAFDVTQGTDDPQIVHKPDVDATTRDESTFRLVYGVVIYKDGTKYHDWMNRAQIDKIKEAAKKRNFGKDSLAWVEHYVEQAKKTLIKRMAKTLPKSSEKMLKVDDVIDKDNNLEFPTTDIDPNAVIVNQDTGEVVDPPRTATGKVEQKLKGKVAQAEPPMPEAPHPADVADTTVYIDAKQVEYFDNLCHSRNLDPAAVRIYLKEFHDVDGGPAKIPSSQYEKIFETIKKINESSINNLKAVDPKLL